MAVRVSQTGADMKKKKKKKKNFDTEGRVKPLLREYREGKLL